jgi:quinol monooxygenase YgiN
MEIDMIVVAKLKAKSGEEAKMEEALRDMVGKVAQEKGTLTYTLHRSQKDPSVFLLYEEYQDGAALKAHSSTPYFKELFGALQSLLDGAPEIEMYDELARVRD